MEALSRVRVRNFGTASDKGLVKSHGGANVPQGVVCVGRGKCDTKILAVCFKLKVVWRRGRRVLEEMPERSLKRAHYLPASRTEYSQAFVPSVQVRAVEGGIMCDELSKRILIPVWCKLRVRGMFCQKASKQSGGLLFRQRMVLPKFSRVGVLAQRILVGLALVEADLDFDGLGRGQRRPVNRNGGKLDMWAATWVKTTGFEVDDNERGAVQRHGR